MLLFCISELPLDYLIESFGDKQTEKLWQGKRTRFPADLLQRAIDKLKEFNNR